MGWRERDYAKFTDDEWNELVRAKPADGNPGSSSFFERPLRWWEVILVVLVLAGALIAYMLWKNWLAATEADAFIWLAAIR